MNLLWRTAFTAAAYAATCSAAVTYTPITSGPSYAVSIPQNTVSSGSGDIYFQLSAPTTYQWVGLGIGSQMAGASIFVMYADGNGNVTISPRSGSGHVEPQVDSSLKVELLAGSGVSNGVMTANVLCTSCSSKLSSTTSTSSSWIAAWNQGSALNSASVSATIAQHSGNAYRQFSLDLTKAVASADTNPFVTSVPSSGGGTATASAIRPTSTSSTNPGAPNSGDSSGVTEIGSSFAAITDYQKAHGIIMGLAVVLLFPIAAILMPLGAGIWVHAAAQMFSFALFIVGFGLGVKLADMTGLLYKSAGRTHTIFGTVILGLFFIQPVLGFLQHKHFVRNQTRGVFGHAHQWYGRILMLLSIINGGLGLKLAANTTGGKIAYSVVAAVVGVAYIGVALGAGLGKRRGGKAVAGERERERERSAI